MGIRFSAMNWNHTSIHITVLYSCIRTNHSMFVFARQEKVKTTHTRTKITWLDWLRWTSLEPHLEQRRLRAGNASCHRHLTRQSSTAASEKFIISDRGFSTTKSDTTNTKRDAFRFFSWSVGRISEPLTGGFFSVCFQSCWEISFFKFININNYFLEGKRHKVLQRSPDSKSLCFVCLSTAVFLWLKLYSVNTYSCLL